MSRGKFRRWIATQGGAAAVSKKLYVTRQAVGAWLRKEAQPSTALAVRLVRLGKGAFDHNDIVRETYKPATRNSK